MIYGFILKDYNLKKQVGGVKMGYTHYYRTKPKHNKKTFLKVVTDFKKMIPALNHLGVKLADPHGENTAILRPDMIGFNGVSNCGHQDRELGITWPSKTAKGVSQNQVGLELAELVKGHWFAGANLETRVCGGDCSHESFYLEQEMTDIADYKLNDLEKNEGLIFGFTKTAYKPYDLAVNVCLIIAKHHLKKDIRISSDGDLNNWIEGMNLCQHFLEYGLDFKLED